MPYAPVLNPYPAQAISQGFSTLSQSLMEQQRRQQQQQQFDAQMGEAQARRALEEYALGVKGGQFDRELAETMRWHDMQNELQMSQTQAQLDPRRIQPVPLPGMPGYFGIPLTGQILQPRAETGTPEVQTDPSGQFYYDGARWKPVPSAGAKLPTAAVQQVMGELELVKMRDAEAQALDAKIAEHNAALAKGDEHFGFLNMSSRQEEVKKLVARKQALQKENAAALQAIERMKKAVGGAGEETPRKPAAAKPAAASPRKAAPSPVVEPPLPALEDTGLPEPEETAAAPAPPEYPSPNPAAIAHLRAHPELALEFETKFGPGSSAPYLAR